MYRLLCHNYTQFIDSLLLYLKAIRLILIQPIKLLLIALIDAILIVAISFYDEPIQNLAYYTEAFKFTIGIAIIGFPIIVFGYLTFLTLLYMLITLPKYRLWTASIFCYFFYYLISDFSFINVLIKEVDLLTFFGANHLFAIANILLFIVFNRNLIRKINHKS